MVWCSLSVKKSLWTFYELVRTFDENVVADVGVGGEEEKLQVEKRLTGKL